MINLKSLSFKELAALPPLIVFELLRRIKEKFFSLQSFKRDAIGDEYRILDKSDVFVLDLRGARVDLHKFSVLIQFFRCLLEKYEIFQVWVDDNTFLFSLSKSYPKEARDIVKLLSYSTKAHFLEKTDKESIDSGYSFLSISSASRALQYTVEETFQEKLNLTSLPVRYKYPLDCKKNPELESLKDNLSKTFNIVFSPTFDLNLKVEPKSRRYGVISYDNFLQLERLYLELQERILREGIDDIKIVFLNKKMLNWKYFPNIVDLRHFEDYGLNFASMLYFIQETCRWSIGSEGTMQCYLMMSEKLKHATYVDNSHWGYTASNGSTVPLFMKENRYLNYRNAPNEYIPDGQDTISQIFQDYYKYKKK